MNNYYISYNDKEDGEIYIIDEETFKRAKLFSEQIVFIIKKIEKNEYKEDDFNNENHFSNNRNNNNTNDDQESQRGKERISPVNESENSKDENHERERRRGKGRVRPSTKNRIRQNNDRENEGENSQDENHERGRRRGKGRIRPDTRNRIRQNNERENYQYGNQERGRRGGKGRIRDGTRNWISQNNGREIERENYQDGNYQRGNFNRGRRRIYRGPIRNFDKYKKRENNEDFKEDYFNNNYNNKNGNNNYYNYNHHYSQNFNRTNYNKNKDNNMINNNNYYNRNYNKNTGSKNKYYNKNYNNNGNFNNKKNNYYQNKKWKNNINDNYNDINKNDNKYSRNNNSFIKEEDDNYNNIKEEFKYEKNNNLNDFKQKYNKIIKELRNLFYAEIEEEKIIEILMNVTSKPSLTIFEAMNLIYREIKISENIIYNKSKINKRYGPESDIYEEKNNSDFTKNNLNKVIQNYKIFDENNGLEKHWLFIDNSDKRRKLLKDENGFYNYLPLYCNDNSKDNEDIYAKNENEILYHSLFYKTLICRYCDINKENNEIEELCPYVHNILKDFRIIYDYDDENIINFMKLLLDSNLFKFENYLNYIPKDLSPKFNLDSFKVHQCMLDSKCPNDYQICPYYHKSNKQDKMRRPQALFRYIGIKCNESYNKKKERFYQDKCLLGIFCHFCNNENEYNYHSDHFRKEKCKNININGKCKYFKTCYKNHSNKYYNNEDSEKEEEEEGENEIYEEIEDDEKIIELTEKINNSMNIGRYLRCRKCFNISSFGQICYFIECNHFICYKCFKSISKKKIILCPFCNMEIKKKKVVFLNFNKNFN